MIKLILNDIFMIVYKDLLFLVIVYEDLLFLVTIISFKTWKYWLGEISVL